MRKREVCPRVKVHDRNDTCALPEQSVKYLCDPSVRRYAGPLLPFFPLCWHFAQFKPRPSRTLILHLFRQRLRLSTVDRSAPTAPARPRRLRLGCSPLFYDQSANGNREGGLSVNQRIQSGSRRAAGEPTDGCYRGVAFCCERELWNSRRDQHSSRVQGNSPPR